MNTSSASRTYNRNECITFRKTKESFGGLSNMAGGYPIIVNGINIRTSEALYQACRFPHLPDIQKVIISQKSPMTAKMKGKPYRDRSRSDWEKVKLNIMRWCLRIKLLQNWETFGKLLLQTKDKPIVEDSRKDNFWGAIPVDTDNLVGINALGRLLMELRETLKKQPETLKIVKPLEIKDFNLYNQPIETISTDLPKEKIYLIFSSFTQQEDSINTAPQKQSDDIDHFSQIKTQNNLQEYHCNIFEKYVLLELEIFLQQPRMLDEILASFKTVTKTQMQHWLKLGIEKNKIRKTKNPVRYIWNSVEDCSVNLKYSSDQNMQLKNVEQLSLL